MDVYETRMECLRLAFDRGSSVTAVIKEANEMAEFVSYGRVNKPAADELAGVEPAQEAEPASA